MSKSKEPLHDIRYDTAGWGSYPRVTCYTPECQGDTILRQPWMTETQWNEIRSKFLNNHSNQECTCHDQ